MVKEQVVYEDVNFGPEPSPLLSGKKANVKYVVDDSHTSVTDILVEQSKPENNEDSVPFFAVDLAEPMRRLRRWKKLLPRVDPFYAVKCNPDPRVLQTMVDNGMGFDCASKNEIETMLSYGVSPERIVFANPCKQISHIKYAAKHGVAMTTFDNADELYKLKKYYPEAKVILRVLTDDSRSVCRLGVKYGAPPNTTFQLLQIAQNLGLNVIGVSFHVGSGCFDPTAFSDAVLVAKKVFDEAESLNLNLELLDIGGGFPGLDGIDGCPFDEVARELRRVLPLIPSHVKIIAEPGRYFVAAAFTLAVSVIARRVVQRDQNGEEAIVNTDMPSRNDHPSFMYYVNDGVYGSFNCLLFDHAKVSPRVLRKKSNIVIDRNGECLLNEEEYSCSIWGPTCDSMDCIDKQTILPQLDIEDFIFFENMGAYTICAASTFNGFQKPKLFYTNTEAPTNTRIRNGQNFH